MISYDKRQEAVHQQGKRRGIKGYPIPSTGVFLEGSGSGDAGVKIWKPVMQKYLQKVPNTSFKEPPRRIEVGKQVRVPSLSGLSYAAANRKLEKAGFTVETALRLQTTTCPQGGFVGWSPGPGSSISQFGTIFCTVLARPRPRGGRGRERGRGGRGRRREEAEEEEEQQQRIGEAEAAALGAVLRTS